MDAQQGVVAGAGIRNPKIFATVYPRCEHCGRSNADKHLVCPSCGMRMPAPRDLGCIAEEERPSLLAQAAALISRYLRRR